MVALFFEVYGALCLFALVVFLVWAAKAKLRPDLDEDELDLGELERLKTLASPEGSSDCPPIEPPVIEQPSGSPPVRRGGPIRRRPVVFHTRAPRTT